MWPGKFKVFGYNRESMVAFKIDPKKDEIYYTHDAVNLPYFAWEYLQKILPEEWK
jgi:hypothetical protein